MTGADLIPAQLLKRKAVVYVRQSTQSQAMTNQESQRRQYDLIDLARSAASPTSRSSTDEVQNLIRKPPLTFSVLLSPKFEIAVSAETSEKRVYRPSFQL